MTDDLRGRLFGGKLCIVDNEAFAIVDGREKLVLIEKFTQKLDRFDLAVTTARTCRHASFDFGFVGRQQNEKNFAARVFDRLRHFFDVRVVEVRTALVDETCRENPSGPGC